MIYVCAVVDNGKVYRMDNKVYTSTKGATERCKRLNGVGNKHSWKVMYQDQFKVWEG